MRDQFAEILETADGKLSQLLAAARILDRARHGDYRDLRPASDHARWLLAN